MQPWELCTVEVPKIWRLDILEDYVSFHFHSPEGYEKLDTGSYLFEVDWPKLSRIRRRELLNEATLFDLDWRNGVCKLLVEGWEPLGSSAGHKGAVLYHFRRPYVPEEDEA